MTQQPVLYLLSGNGSTRRWWEDTIPFFKTVRPVAIELPGFGDNPDTRFGSLDELAGALIEMTPEKGEIFACGVNALVALQAQVRKPGHFSKLILLAPVGAFLWERGFVKLMSLKPMRSMIHFLLRRYPKVFRKKFSAQRWTDAQYDRMGEGYRKCRAFKAYFDFVKPWTALNLLEWVEGPVELIWGSRDAVLDARQIVAWDSILPRAELRIQIREDWGHYPYIDDPEGFAAYAQAMPEGWRAHTKGGRLKLAAMAGLPVPKARSVFSAEELVALKADLKGGQYAVRSSNSGEDQIDGSQAGLNDSFLRVPVGDVAAKAAHLLEQGMDEVVVQEFVAPKVSGVAFVRKISMEVDWVEGHLEALVNGKVEPERVILTKMGKDWKAGDPGKLRLAGVDPGALVTFLQTVIQAFHYHPSDVEWAWDGKQFWLFQIRPVSAYTWRRCLTSANLDEILPRQVSGLMEQAQRRASLSIGRIYGLWDSRVLSDHEPFSVVWQDASYINSDLFLARFRDWGLPSSLYANEIGGAVPEMKFHLGRFLRNIPVFIRMTFAARKAMLDTSQRLAAFEAELAGLEAQLMEARAEFRNTQIKGADIAQLEAALVNWFVRFYVFIVQQNMVINACLSSSFGKFLGRPRTVYQHLDAESAPHRLVYESDPATARPDRLPPALEAYPSWSGLQKLMHRLGAPGLNGLYFQIREWFRDNNMRLFHRLHLQLQCTEYLLPHPGIRSVSGTFWEDGSGKMQQSRSFVIYPGSAEGRVGEDILLVDALEPGHYARYKQAKAVIARTGGRLSHGATLLRELKKPAAVMPEAGPEWEGKVVHYADGALSEIALSTKVREV